MKHFAREILRIKRIHHLKLRLIKIELNKINKITNRDKKFTFFHFQYSFLISSYFNFFLTHSQNRHLQSCPIQNLTYLS